MKSKYEDAWWFAIVVVICVTCYACVSTICKSSLASEAIKAGHITLKK